MRPSLVRDDEQPTVRRSRTPLHVRVRQVLAAVEILDTRDVQEMLASDIVADIDQRLSTSQVAPAIDELVNHGVLELATPPEKQKYRKWRVVDWTKVKAFRRALEGGGELPKIIPESSTVVSRQILKKRVASRWRRWGRVVFAYVKGWLTLPSRLNQTERRLEALLKELEWTPPN